MKNTCHYLLFAALFAAVFTAGGCKDSDIPDPKKDPPALELLSDENLDVPAEGGAFTVLYELTGPREDGAVTAAANAGWITVTDYSVTGKAEFTVSANETGEARSGKVTVTYSYNGGESVSASVAVSQSIRQDEPTLTLLSDENLDVQYEGGSFTVTYELTGPREDGAVTAAADAGWITVTDYSVPGKVEFTVPLNETFEARTGKVTVTYSYNGGESVSASVTVSQASHPPLPDYDIDFVAEKLTGYYYGQSFSQGYADYWFFFSDKGFEADDSALPNATYFHVDLYAALAPVPYDGGIPVGFYTLDASQTYPEGTFSSDMSYYYITDDAAEVAERHYFTEGTLSVEKDGSDYVLELTVTFDDGKKARAKYKGGIDLMDKSDDTPEVHTTLTGDHAADLTGCIGTALFYADYYEVGASNWTVDITPETYPGEGFVFDLNCTGSFDEGIPSGRYEVADSYAAGTIYPGYMQYGYMYGTWWIGYASSDDMPEYAPAISGGIDVTRNDDGTYTFAVDFYDDASAPNRITGTWTGTLVMENRRPSPAPDTGYPAWGQTVTAKRHVSAARPHPAAK